MICCWSALSRRDGSRGAAPPAAGSIVTRADDSYRSGSCLIAMAEATTTIIAGMTISSAWRRAEYINLRGL
ncbi:MAG TPA: hypothetical protein VFO63_03100 [Blastocatellia bacterium]|nr:hypothetical protein [Blastocatellia bacterium]